MRNVRAALLLTTFTLFAGGGHTLQGQIAPAWFGVPLPPGLFTSLVRSDLRLVALVILGVPLARLAATPLVVSWSRHR